MVTRKCLAAILCILSAAFAHAQTFHPDTTFGTNGIASPQTISFPGTTSVVWVHEMLGSAIQADGKVVMAGTGNFHSYIEVVRLNTDGTLDTSFNHSGYNVYNANGIASWVFTDMKVTPSGKIMVGYYSEDFLNTRYSLLCIQPNGALDPSFGIGGKSEVGAALAGKQLLLMSMDVQPDGKVLLAGQGTDAFNKYKYVVARIKTNGTPDTSFGTNGLAFCPIFTTQPRNVMVQPIKLQADGKILISGNIPTETAGTDSMYMARYKANGTLDSAYGVNGVEFLPESFMGGAIRLDTDNNAYVIGRESFFSYSDTFYIRKFSPSGIPVTAFGTGGKLRVNAKLNIWNGHEQFTNLGHFEIVGGGKMLVCGNSDSSATSSFRVCRLLADGTPDISFAANGTITVPRGKRDYCSNVVPQPDGKIVLTGFSRSGEGAFDTATVLAMRFWDGVNHDTTTADTTSTSAVPITQVGNGAGVFPNPVAGNSFIYTYCNAAAACNATYQLVNIMGQQVCKGNFTMQQGSGSISVSIPHALPAGQYLLHVKGENLSGAYRVVITR